MKLLGICRKQPLNEPGPKILGEQLEILIYF